MFAVAVHTPTQWINSMLHDGGIKLEVNTKVIRTYPEGNMTFNIVAISSVIIQVFHTEPKTSTCLWHVSVILGIGKDVRSHPERDGNIPAILVNCDVVALNDNTLNQIEKCHTMSCLLKKHTRALFDDLF